MKRAIENYRVPFSLLIAVIAVGLLVAAWVLTNQRFSLPGWVPLIGSDVVAYEIEFSTGQALTPGQGQTVNIAGVPVGEIASVRLRNGRAVAGVKIRRAYAHLYENATATLRPKTGLNDMVIALDPGTDKAPEIEPGGMLPAARTEPNVNFDEVLSMLDADTRDYLRLLIAGGAEGLGGQGRELSAALRRFAPITRDVRVATDLLAERRRNLRRAVTNFGLLMEAVGSKDRELTELVRASNTSLRALARQDRRLRAALRQLPGTLEQTERAMAQTERLADRVGPAAGTLLTGARKLAGTQRALRPFFEQTTPIIRDKLRPLARDGQPAARLLRPTAADLAAAAPDFTTTLKTANHLLNLLAYNPPGSREGFGYYLAWVNHLTPQMFAGQDAHGPIRRGAILFSCEQLSAIERSMVSNPVLYAVLGLTNPVSTEYASGGDRRCDTSLRTATGLLGK